MNEKQADALVEEMRSIKKLLILQHLKMGYKQTHLAATLGVSDATMSRMLPKGLPKGATNIDLSSD